MKIDYHSDHLGSASFVTDRGGNVVQHLQYLPYGELFVSQRNSEEFDSRYKFTAKELDNETSYTYFGARYYDSDLSVWLSVDPMSDKYPSTSAYMYCAGNPVILVDPNGMAPDNPPWVDYYYSSVTSKTIGFSLRYPLIALKIGTVKPGATNISTNAVRFATRIGLNENAKREGSEVNAFRHALWQAAITSLYGENIAIQIGNAHESNPNTISLQNYKTNFTKLSEADQIVDLLNNMIGRYIGKSNPNSNMKELSLFLLDYYKEKGLWTVNINNNGTNTSYSISQTTLSQEQYQYAKSIINNLNPNGFTSEEQLNRDKISQDKNENLKRIILTNPQ